MPQAFARGLGDRPLPCNGKIPSIQGWGDIAATDRIISTWETKYADALNTGILTRDTPAIDIDVLDPSVANELQDLAEQLIGATTARLGQAPKRALLYRTDEPFDKLSTPVFTSPDGRSHKVEVLGRGQQIIVHGIHPTTHAPYVWQGGEPGPELPHDKLPLLTADKAAEFIFAASDWMAAHGWTETSTKKANGNGASSDRTWNTPAGNRERAYASAALDGCAEEVAQAAVGERNDSLNKKAFRLGST